MPLPDVPTHTDRAKRTRICICNKHVGVCVCLCVCLYMEREQRHHNINASSSSVVLQLGTVIFTVVTLVFRCLPLAQADRVVVRQRVHDRYHKAGDDDQLHVAEDQL